MDEVPAEYARHYNGHRPHQALQQQASQREPGRVVDVIARIECGKVPGGLIRAYTQVVCDDRVIGTHMPRSATVPAL